jgi:transposase-like protein
MKSSTIITRAQSKNKNKNHCPYCDNSGIRIGAERRSSEQSQRCAENYNNLGYSSIDKLKKFYKRRKLTESLDFLRNQRIREEELQLTILQVIGGES